MVQRLVLFDGVCGFCDRMVGWLMARDRGRLRYAPLQGETAAALRARHPEIPVELETVVYVETEGACERVSLRSEAAFRILGQLRAPWRWLALLGWLPRSLMDPAYRAFARRRYRLFGRLDECRIPAPEERARMLD